jgi:nicotinamide/nicotinate riboside kinase
MATDDHVLTLCTQPTLDSKEDQNSVGKCPVPESTIAALRDKVSAALSSSHPLQGEGLRLCLLDGFLLYSPSMQAIQSSLDVKIFVRASYAKAKARREARDGYVTIEGFWTDPPGYVDKIVWPNYVEEHAWMFDDGNVEGAFRGDVLDSQGIKVLKEAAVDADMEQVLDWMVEVVIEELQKHS